MEEMKQKIKQLETMTKFLKNALLLHSAIIGALIVRLISL